MHYLFHCLCAKLLQSCPTICDAMDSSLPDSSVPWHSPGKNTGVGCHTLLQVTVPNQEWNARPLCLLHWCVCMLSHFGHVWLCAPLWTIACQAPLSTGFPRQEYWGGVPCLLPTLAGRFFTTSASWEAPPFSAVVVAVVQSLSRVSLWPHGPQHARLPCPSPSPRACSNSSPLSQWYHPTILSSVIHFSSCLQSFPAPRSFLMSQFFATDGQSIGARA